MMVLMTRVMLMLMMVLMTRVMIVGPPDDQVGAGEVALLECCVTNLVMVLMMVLTMVLTMVLIKVLMTRLMLGRWHCWSAE